MSFLHCFTFIVLELCEKSLDRRNLTLQNSRKVFTFPITGSRYQGNVNIIIKRKIQRDSRLRVYLSFSSRGSRARQGWQVLKFAAHSAHNSHALHFSSRDPESVRISVVHAFHQLKLEGICSLAMMTKFNVKVNLDLVV